MAGLAACNTDRPLAPTRPSANVVAASDSTPFYYYEDQKIYLTVDPSRVVVSTVHGVDPATAVVTDAQTVLAPSGIALDSVKSLMQAPDHAIVYLPKAVPTVASTALRSALTKDSRFRFVSPVYTVQTDGSNVIPLDRVVVKFRSGVSDGQIMALADSLGLAVERTPNPNAGFDAYWFTYPSNPATNTLALAAALDQNSLVSWADPDKIGDRRPALVPSDPYFSYEYFLKNSYTLNGVPVDIDAESAWDLSTGSSSITVAVLDEGVQQAQPDVGPALVNGYDTYTIAGEDAYHPCLTCQGGGELGDAHGTAVAGIVGARQDNGQGITGIAPGVQLVSVRVLRNFAGNSDAEIASGINWAWSTGHADVLNNSWGGGDPNNAITNAVQSALASGRGGKGSVVVFAAGNNADNPDFPAPLQYPASLAGSKPGVIAVGAIGRYGNLSEYSCTGTALSVVAPSSYSGGDLTTTDLMGGYGYNNGPAGNNDYTTVFGGTSAATPQIAGIAALILSREPGLSASDVRGRIEMSADPWGAGAPNPDFGWGKANAYKALIDFGVAVDGPFFVRRTGLATWKVDIVRGVEGTYTYTWEYSENGSSWTTVGTSATYSKYVQLGDPWFYLRVSVNSGLATMQASHRIIVAPQ